MGKILAVSLVLFVAVLCPQLRAQEYSQYEPFSPDQLDNLLAPIALYPDPLLAQVLVAATFPDQIDEASRFVRTYRNANDIDDQWWDVSVKAVGHYPTVLAMMADKLDWTTALGQAYAYQSTDVMGSIQRLRIQARRAGNLNTTSQMQVVDSGGEIEIWPAQPQYLYVPMYDPGVVYFHRTSFSFGLGFVIGAWLNYDFDWGGHRVFYHGWEGNGGWIGRSRQYVHPNNYYVNNTYRNVVINRRVTGRPLNYGALNRYDDVHRTTNFNNFRGSNRAVTQPPLLPGRVVSRPPAPPFHVTVPNKIITRNFDTTNPRIYDYRGHVQQPAVQVHVPVAPAFNPVRGGFDPHVTSVRGQTSRALVLRTPPPVVHTNVVRKTVRPPVKSSKDKNDGKKH
jgi:hypothetical protein